MISFTSNNPLRTQLSAERSYQTHSGRSCRLPVIVIVGTKNHVCALCKPTQKEAMIPQFSPCKTSRTKTAQEFYAVPAIRMIEI